MSISGVKFLTPEEERVLLRIARESLEHYAHTGEMLDLCAFPLTPALEEKHGAFVTIRKGGALRGCIGYTKSLEALAEAVRDNAVNAAMRDPRFDPVRPAELPELHIEVSALCPGDEPGSPFIEVKDLDEIVLGRDGLYLDSVGTRGGGLLLPQVPLEQGWDRDAFLAGLCKKANAPERAWEDPEATLYRFSAQVFGE